MVELVERINSTLWFALLFLLVGTGVIFTFRLRFIQVRKFKQYLKAVFGGIKIKGEAAGAEGMSSFQAMATAMAAQLGTGNIGGIASALVVGGPGAIFWMCVSAFFGTATIYAEAVLGQKYKTTVEGQVIGGPVYYIRAAFKGTFGKFLAGAFAVLIIFALGFMGNVVQANTISVAFESAFGIHRAIVSVALAALTLFIFLGGLKRIVSVVERVIPIMAAAYMLLILSIIVLRITHVPDAIRMVFVGAFNPEAVLGGVLGVTVKEAIRYGVARGLFSNEAGMGSTPHAHAVAKVKHPCDQGLVAMCSVFIDTVLLIGASLVILTTGVLDGTVTSVALTQKAFESVFGHFGVVAVAICLFFFASTTIIGWYYFGESNVRYLIGKKAIPVYAILVAICVAVSSTLEAGFVWELADLFNGLMVIPNLLGLLALIGVLAALTKEFEQKDK